MAPIFGRVPMDESKQMKITHGISCAILVASSVAMLGQQQPATPDPQENHPTSQPSQVPAATPSAPAAAPGQALPPTEVKIPAESQQTPSSATSPASGAKTAGVDNARYIIGPEDALQISVWREPSLSGNLPVRPDGMISMVLLGDLPAAGMTPTALGADITQRLRKYFQDPPSVTVQVMAVNSQRIYMIGELGHVGPVPLSSGMTPLQAIATAGGLSPFANSKHIYILRGSGASQQKIPFNYKQALKGEDRQPIVLRPGDTIVVP